MSSRVSTIGQSINQCAYRDAHLNAVLFKEKGHWQEKKWADYYSTIKEFAGFLLSLGLQPGERVAIISNSRYEWGVTDFAVLGVHGVTVPIYYNSTAEDIEFILNDSKAKIVFVEGRESYRIVAQVRKKCPSIEHLVSFEKLNEHPELLSFSECLKKGALWTNSNYDKFYELCEELKPEQIATLIYTSGTTGRPKGVLLCHEQIVSEVSEAFPLCGATADDTSLSFLPFAHVLGRIELWAHMYIGFCMAYAESIEKLKNNLVEVKPTFLISVPRIFEKVYTAIWSQSEANPIKKRLFEWAVKVGLEVGERKLSHQTLPLTLLAEYEAAQRLVLSKVKMAFGGRLRFAISGGAPLAREIALFFHACDVLVLEGYGLSETTAAICVNTPFNYRFGSVGRPIGDVQIKIASDGEILVKSKKVMREYYNNPKATAEVFSDGWFHTGDIGEILPGGDIRITDRKKDLIKTAGGKYVAPQRLEGLLKMHPLIAYAHIHGDQKKYVVVLLSLDRLQLEKFAQEHNIAFQDWTDLTRESLVLDKVRGIIAEVNRDLASFESIKRFQILPKEFTVEGGELTPSLKVKRKVLDQRYEKEIESLYD